MSSTGLLASCAQEGLSERELPWVSDSEDHSDPRPSPSQGLSLCIPAGEPAWPAPLTLNSVSASFCVPTLDRALCGEYGGPVLPGAAATAEV